MLDLAYILADARRTDPFKAFLRSRGCEVMVGTNPYEILRFKRQGRINVVYRKKSGKLTIVGSDVDLAIVAYDQMLSRQKGGKPPKKMPPALNVASGRPARRDMRRTKLRGSSLHKALLARDGDRCFYCGKKLGNDQTREHLLAVNHDGPDRIENQVLAHHACNVEAADLPIVEKIKLRDRLRAKRKRR